VGRYIGGRVIQGVLVLIASSMVLFGLMHLAPGGPLAVYAGNPGADPAELRRIEQELGLRDPLPEQYVRWFSSMLRGNWGDSYRDGRPAASAIGERLPATLLLMGTSVLIALAVAVPLGVLGAISRRPAIRAALSVFAVAGMSIPGFWLGIMVLVLFAVQLHVIPTGGMTSIGGRGSSALDVLFHLIAPALVLATHNTATWSRFIRSGMLEVLGQDYIRTAQSKGLTTRRVLYGHALKNALLPLITLLGLEAPRLVSGALVIEVVFGWPGIGRLLTESVLGRDYPVLMAAFLLSATLVVVGNLVADLTYSWVDPRIRLR
jgi:peptide/nickel transport system permease protein